MADSTSPLDPLPHTLSGGGKSLGERLCDAFAATFEGGGWADAPAWEDFDAHQQNRWEKTAALFIAPLALPPAAGAGVAWREEVARIIARAVINARNGDVSYGPKLTRLMVDNVWRHHVEDADAVLLALSAAPPPADHDASEGRGGSSAGSESAARGNPYPAPPAITEQSGKEDR